MRGFEGNLYEGGLRAPAVVEWHAGIPESCITKHSAATIDNLPAVAALAGPLEAALLQPQDGAGLSLVLAADDGPREKPIGFRRAGRAALINNNLKIVDNDRGTVALEVCDLESDPRETRDLN